MSLKTDANRPSIKRVDLIERRKAHLDVELRKLRLAIGAQIFVTKTVRDLKVLIETADHAQLFEELRRLRQREKLSRENTRRHDVIARAFGRRFDQDRRFDLGETLRRHVAPDFVQSRDDAEAGLPATAAGADRDSDTSNAGLRWQARRARRRVETAACARR